MSKKDPISGDINNRINFPKGNSGLANTQQGGKVNTNWSYIRWTTKKIFFVSIALGFPYLVAVVASFVAEIYLVTAILISLGVLVALLVQFTRWIDRNNDF